MIIECYNNNRRYTFHKTAMLSTNSLSHSIEHLSHWSNQCFTNRVLTRRVYGFRYQNRVNLEVNSIFGKIGMYDEFARVKLG